MNVPVGGEGSLGTPLDRPRKPPSTAVNLHAAPGRAETLAKVCTRYIGARKEKFPKTCLDTSSMDFMAQILFHR